MDVFIDELAPDEIHALAQWLLWLRTATEDDIRHLDDL